MYMKHSPWHFGCKRVGLFYLILLMTLIFGLRAEDEISLADADADTSQIAKLNTEELHTLVAPIALYPDALLAQILPASTFPTQVVEAYRYSQSGASPDTPPENSTWDSSVISLLHYPPVLKKLNDDLTWTEQLGVVVTYQMEDVTQAIQQVRAEAQAAGNLVSNDKQSVVVEREIIQIVPADPQFIYVPSYDPIYISEPYYVGRPFYSWGSSFGLGLWLGDDFDWRNHRIWRRNSWYGGSWNQHRNPSAWRPHTRPIPTWYSRHGGTRPGLPGTQRGTVPLKSTLPRPDRIHPNRPPNTTVVKPPASTRPTVKRPTRLSPDGEGSNNRGHQTIKESHRGRISRDIVKPKVTPRPAPVRQTPVRPAPRVTPTRPSIRQETRNYTDRSTVQRQSNRGTTSRSSGNKGSVQKKR